MSRSGCVVLCGDSVFMYGLEVGLTQLPNLSVARFAIHQPELMELIKTFNPDMLIIEKNFAHNFPIDLCLEQGWRILLVSADSNQTVFVQGQSIELNDFDALARLIQPAYQ